jgi:ribosomal protein S18 acetylase RimI-like enzyme
MTVREAHDADRDNIWRILEPVIRAGETYTLPRDWNREETLAYWLADNHAVFVAEADGVVVGTYFLQANQRGGGAHVANCGYVTAACFSGRGAARLMCRHSLETAKARGFLAMQFNFVVSSNERAIALWKTLGFEIVGTLPDAFQHPELGFVNAFVMYRRLDEV